MVFQLINARSVRRITSGYKIRADEWDAECGRIIIPQRSSPRYGYLVSAKWALRCEMAKLRRLASEGGGMEAGSGTVAAGLVPYCGSSDSVFGFIDRQARLKCTLGRVRSAETYRSALNSFMRFRGGADLAFCMLDGELMERYEAWMLKGGLARNTTSFYMRILRTIYKLAVEQGLTADRRPFRRVYCGMDKTVKRSVALDGIRRIKALDLSRKPGLDYARDMFIFSFCTRGMSFVDMAFLKKADLRGGYLTYRRKKTGQLLTMEWTRQMQGILDKYAPNATQYLLPIIAREDGSERRQYQNQMRKVNRRLKDIARLAGLAIPPGEECAAGCHKRGPRP